MFSKKITLLFMIPFLCTSLFISSQTAQASSNQTDSGSKTVVQMQQLLNSNGYWCGPAEGVLGSEAYQAVVNLAIDNHMLADGFIGARTRQSSQLALLDSQVQNVSLPGNTEGTSLTAPVINETSGKNVQVAAQTVNPSRGSSSVSNRVITMVATGYDDSYECNQPYYGAPSYIGLPLERGIVAVDPNVIPMGTRLYVEGYGAAIAADQGSAIKGNRIDLFFDSHQEALNWGMKTVKVTILGK